MGHIYCNKAGGGQHTCDLERNLACTPPHRTHSPKVLYCWFLRQRSTQWGVLIIISRVALIEREGKKSELDLVPFFFFNGDWSAGRRVFPRGI